MRSGRVNVSSVEHDLTRSFERMRFRSWPFQLLETCAAFASVAVLLGTVLGVAFGESVWAAISVAWVCLLATALLLLLMIQERRTRRRVSYAFALTPLHRVFHELRDAEAAMINRNAKGVETLPVLRSVMSATATTFEIITGTACRACVKQVMYPTDPPVDLKDQRSLRDLQVQTLARDEETGKRPGDGRPCFVDHNTDFEMLLAGPHDPGRTWFVSNDLEAMDTYKNSSWKAGEPKEYLAACVWPIQKTDDTDGTRHDILGFLCVDTMETDVFDLGFDFHVGAAIADGLYPFLKMLRLQQQSDLKFPEHSQHRES